MRPTRLSNLLTACLLLGACSGEGSDLALEVASKSAGGAAADAAAPMPEAPPAPAADLASRREVMASGFAARTAEADAAPALPQSAVAAAADSARPMIIRTGEARVEVDSLEVAVEAVERAAQAVGGWVAHSALQLGAGQWRSARLEVKVPAERWSELLGGLDALGELRQLSTSTEDVGEQFVDLNAQLANSRRLEERYLQLLQTRTGSLEDLLAVERELARVRERIERVEGRLRYLGQRVAVSTLVVNLDEGTDLLSAHPGERPIRDALRGAWRNFLAVITGGIELLGALLPVGVLVSLAVWGWRRWRRRYPRVRAGGGVV